MPTTVGLPRMWPYPTIRIDVMKSVGPILVLALTQLLWGEPVLAQTASRTNAVAPVGAATVTDTAHPLSSPTLESSQRTDSDLESRGILLGGWLQTDISGVPVGGQPDGNPVDGQYLLDLSATMDTQKLFGLPGGTFFADA